MKTRGVVTIAVLAAIGAVALGATGAVWVVKHPDELPLPQVSFGHRGKSSGATVADARQDEPVTDSRAFRYVSLEKVIVMLRKPDGTGADEHYLSIDLVFPTPAENEGDTREQLPLLRSVAVQTLSKLTVDAADRASIDDIGGQINEAYDQTYAHDRHGKPFAEVKIAKLIVE